MGGCSAFNCSNNSRKNIRLFKFPRDPERRKKWTISCRRQNWEPGPSAELCEVHFEESQFESHRADGWRKLKPTAIPTLFNVPNPPMKPTLQTQKWMDLLKPRSLLNPGPSDEIEEGEEVILGIKFEKSAEICNSDDHGLISERTQESDRNADTLQNIQSRHVHKKQKMTASASPSSSTDAVPKLEEIASKKETEFDVWAKSLAMQLNNMHLARALRLQLKIQSLMTEERIAHDCGQ